ncbi:MAG TPA: hypothetical protein VIS76_12930 [Pseudomonadales bacterium]
MNWEAVGALSEFLGAIGVIGTLIYLASQVRDGKEATLANTRQMRQNGVRELMLLMSDSDHVSPILVKLRQP